MNQAKAVSASNITLPWSASLADEKRFRLIVAICLILALILSITLPFINLPEQDRIEAEKIPPRLAKMLLEKKKVKPPKVVAPKPPEPEKPKLEEEKKPEPKPEPKPKKKPEPKPEPKAEPKPKPKPKRDVAEIRKKVANTGVLAMADMLADLRETQPIATLKSTKPLQTEGTQERAMTQSVLVAKASKGSGGIDTSKFSRTASDNELDGRETSTVTSEIAEMEVEATTSPVNKARLRSEEEIKKVMRANYAPINSIYRRATRQNPLLHGKVLFRIVIEPDGSVSDCQVIDSELGDPKLERKLSLRIKRINFGAKDVEATTIDFPIDFLPG